MDIQNLKRNKSAIFVSVLALIIAGAVIFAQNDRNSTNDIGSIFQKKVTIPFGTQIIASLNTPINSGGNNIGDPVSATVTSPISVENNLAIPAGSKVYGSVSVLEKAANNPGEVRSGAIGLTFNNVELPDGKRYGINGSVPVMRSNVITETTQGYTGRSGGRAGAVVKDALIGAATGAALGTAVGAIAGRGGRGAGRGAWSGAAIGGGLGTAKGLYDTRGGRGGGSTFTTTKQIGQEAVLQSGTQVSITLSSPVKVIAQNLP